MGILNNEQFAKNIASAAFRRLLLLVAQSEFSNSEKYNSEKREILFKILLLGYQSTGSENL